MRNKINILGNDQVFAYIVEYSKNTVNSVIHTDTVSYSIDNDVIHLFEDDVKYYRNKNDWYSIDMLSDFTTAYLPKNINHTKLRVYLPNHSVSTYKRGVKYAVSLNTWIADKKIDLGSYIFRPTDTIASEGIVKDGNNEYHEYIEFDIIDPFYIIYSDDWQDFRAKICNEVKNFNGTCSSLNVTLYVIDEYDNRYLINKDYSGGTTSFTISQSNDYLAFNLSLSLDPLGLECTVTTNEVYNWFLTYLYETYNLDVSHNNLKFQIVIKNKDEIIVGPEISYNPFESYGKITQYISIQQLFNNQLFKTFFESWEAFEEGWSFVGSLVVKINNDDELFSVVSNELNITQEVFSIFTADGAEKIIDIEDMQINTYNVVNKIENKIVQLERPNESKSNIIQPVFFKVKELELLTLHPMVTENICINLDDYKSKVKRFILQIDTCKFEQIGANSYGILFKIPANILNADVLSGTYYILNEEFELVTTGKYNCVR